MEQIKEMEEGWGTCPSCKKKYVATMINCGVKDIEHKTPCPNCGATVGYVPEGTKDFILQTEECFEREIPAPSCPECGRIMVRKYGYSDFWGCSNYPKCDGTRQID